MSTITLQNFRVGSDLTVKVRLKDGGVAIDWSTLSGIRAVLYSDAQSSIAGRCDVTVDGEDPTLLVCRYAATKMQYLGVNRIVVSVKYMGMTKTYDKPAFTFVRWTEDQAGEEITIEDPEVTVEIDVEDVSSSILQEAVDAAFSAADRANEAVDAAFSAADRANEAAEAAEHMVDIHTGPAGKSAYEVAVEEGYTGTEEEWLASLKGPVGETPDISIGTVTTVEPGTPAAASMTGTPEAPVLNLSIPKGLVGATPNFTVGTVTTGEPGSSVIVTITGTPEAPVLNLTIPQGMQGNTGSSVDYPYELVNNLTTNDATKGLSAAQGVVLAGQVSQLQQEINGETIITEVEIDYMSINGHNALINASNKWEATTLYPCAIVSVNPGETYKFVKNDNPGTIAVLKTDTFANNTTPDFSSSYPGRINNADIPATLTIPSDAHYLYIRKKTMNGNVDLDVFRLDESTGDGLKDRVEALEDNEGKVSTTIEESDLSGIYPFYINAGAKQWTTHTNSLAFCYRVFKGQKVTIVANSSEDASIAFVANMNTKSGDSVQFANGTNSVQSITINGVGTYTISEDCYLYVFRRGSNASSNRFPASITITEEDAPIFKKENRSDDSGNWPYYGVRPDFKSRRFGQRLFASLPGYTGHTGLHQGMAVYGDYLVLFTYSDSPEPSTCTAVLYDIPTATKLAEINLPYSTLKRPHGNVLSFGVGLHSADSIAPPLYVSQWDEDGERGVLVYDITLSGSIYSASLIQTIVPNIDGSIFGNGAVDWVVYAEGGFLYSVGYKSTGGSDIDNDETNPTMICKFSLPSFGTSSLILTTSDLVDHYQIRSLPYRQGLCIAGDIMMIQRGNANVGHADWLDVHFLDLPSRTIKTVFPLQQFGGELEGIALYNGQLIMGWRNNANIYVFDF